MRNLTITRKKSFVGCLVKDKLYIRDDQAPELVIEGEPCRKMGDIKNGETKTFQIGDEEQKVFAIADKISKDYCNSSVVIPAGQEDVAYAGKHHFVLGSNPFRFEGVELTPEQIAKQKKNGRKGIIIFIAAIVIGFLIGFLPGLLRDSEPAPKTFSDNGFTITLTEEFEEMEVEGYDVAYVSDAMSVFALAEAKELVGDVELKEYARLVVENNNHAGLTITEGDGFVWAEYTADVEGQEVYYLVVCVEGEEDFWIVNFATPDSNKETCKDIFLGWAKGIEISKRPASVDI